eukprot:7249961-Alexandrium_andersonii.AAC.1
MSKDEEHHPGRALVWPCRSSGRNSLAAAGQAASSPQGRAEGSQADPFPRRPADPAPSPADR